MRRVYLRSAVRGHIAAINLAVMCCMAVGAGACGANHTTTDPARLRQIEQLLEKVPIHPTFIEVDRLTISEASEAEAAREYRSSAPFDEVSSFYQERLVGSDWKFVDQSMVKDRGRLKGERLLEFRQGDYDLDVKYAGRRAQDLGWNYAIEIRWRSE